MDNNEIRSSLQRISQQEIGDDMNLWPAIQEQLSATPNRRTRRMLKIARYTAILAALLMFTAIGYALYQASNVDVGLNDDMVTVLELTQTVEDVTVTLDWAYADANRIAIFYSTAHEASLNPGNAVQVTLRDSSGHEFLPFFGGGGGGGGGSDSLVISSANSNFDASIIEVTPEALDLTLEIVYGDPAMPPGAPGGRGGGGGGGGGNGPAPVATPEWDGVERRFEFEFTIPFIPATPYEAKTNPVEAEGITIRLASTSITPSFLSAQICLNLEANDLAGSWAASSYVRVDDIPYMLSSRKSAELDSGESCYTLETAAPLEPEQDLQLVIDYLYVPEPNYTEERVEDFVQNMADAGFDLINVEIFPGGGLGFGTEGSLSEADASGYNRAIEDNKRIFYDQIVDGPWVFELNTE